MTHIIEGSYTTGNDTSDTLGFDADLALEEMVNKIKDTPADGSDIGATANDTVATTVNAFRAKLKESTCAITRKQQFEVKSNMEKAKKDKVKKRPAAAGNNSKKKKKQKTKPEEESSEEESAEEESAAAEEEANSNNKDQLVIAEEASSSNTEQPAIVEEAQQSNKEQRTTSEEAQQSNKEHARKKAPKKQSNKERAPKKATEIKEESAAAEEEANSNNKEQPARVEEATQSNTEQPATVEETKQSNTTECPNNKVKPRWMPKPGDKPPKQPRHKHQSVVPHPIAHTGHRVPRRISKGTHRVAPFPHGCVPERAVSP